MPDSVPPARPDASLPPAQPRLVRSEDLLQGQRELIILHEGAAYRLTVTRNGKLILTK
ncbi:MAG: hemin uptake protein HemP [Planctomycetes bacterium]|nr:hemin uptake protein HemP [Planctomycetota bacterium]